VAGVWGVGEGGVKVGMERYREVDSRECCVEYVVDFWC
jgi:hypothetical protein